MDENVWKFFSSQKLSPKLISTLVPSLPLERGESKKRWTRGIVIFSLSLSPFFFPPPSSPPRGSRRVCRRVLTDTGHVLATSSGLSLFPRRFWNTLSSQTTAAAVLNKLLLARVRHASTKSSTLLPATRHSNFPNFFPPI